MIVRKMPDVKFNADYPAIKCLVIPVKLYELAGIFMDFITILYHRAVNLIS